MKTSEEGVLAYEPPRRLAFTWNGSAAPAELPPVAKSLRLALHPAP